MNNIPPVFQHYTNALWERDAKTAAKKLVKIYEHGVQSPFRTKIILNNLPTQPNWFKKIINNFGYIATLIKIDRMPEVLTAKEKFNAAIKENNPSTALVRDMLIAIGRVKADKVLPKASQKYKISIKSALDRVYTQKEKNKLLDMWNEFTL